MSNDQLKPRPVAEVRLGNIKAAIWKNDSGDGTRMAGGQTFRILRARKTGGPKNVTFTNNFSN